MRIRSTLLLFSILFIHLAFSQDTVHVTNYLVGETVVSIHAQKFSPYRSKITFINVHDNEQTSVKAAENYLAACGGGTLVHISNQQERFINICVMGKPYTFDPNRIYSEAGRNNTLQILSADFEDTAQCAVANLANQILKNYINGSKLIIAVHNNKDSSLSVLSYKEAQAGKSHFGRVYINPEMDPDDFILTTDFLIFKKIKQRKMNAVWENTRLMNDDGSLSIYAGFHKIPYINIEAQHEHAEEQLNMLNAIDNIIKEYGRKKTIRKKVSGFKKPLKTSRTKTIKVS